MSYYIKTSCFFSQELPHSWIFFHNNSWRYITYYEKHLVKFQIRWNKSLWRNLWYDGRIDLMGFCLFIDDWTLFQYLFVIYWTQTQGYILYISINTPPPSFWDSFFPRRISLRRRDEAPPDATTAGGLEGGRKTPPRNFTVYNPKRCIFKAFSPVFM